MREKTTQAQLNRGNWNNSHNDSEMRRRRKHCYNFFDKINGL